MRVRLMDDPGEDVRVGVGPVEFQLYRIFIGARKLTEITLICSTESETGNSSSEKTDEKNKTKSDIAQKNGAA